MLKFEITFPVFNHSFVQLKALIPTLISTIQIMLSEAILEETLINQHKRITIPKIKNFAVTKRIIILPGSFGTLSLSQNVSQK